MSKTTTVVLHKFYAQGLPCFNIAVGGYLNDDVISYVGKVAEVLQNLHFLVRLMLLSSKETFALRYEIGFAASCLAVGRHA